MKKLLVVALALLLAAAPAMAEYAVTPVELNYPELDNANGALIAEFEADGEDVEAIFAYDGTRLSEGYSQIYTAYGDHPHVLEVYNRGNNPTGKLSGAIRDDGTQLVPPKYDVMELASDRWQVGITLKAGTEGDYDYNVFGDTNEKYQVDAADVYFDGRLVASVGRDVCVGRVKGYGAYLGMMNSAGQSFFLDAEGNVREADYYYDEYDVSYDEDGNRVYIHNGTGQRAFVPECTLTAEEVETAFVLQGTQALDLQGNVICEYAREYASAYDFVDGLAIVYDEDYELTGVVDLNGAEVIPTAYRNIGDGSDASQLVELGYIFAEDAEEKVGALDAAGNVTVDFAYDGDSAWNYYSFLVVDNEDGTQTVVSAAVGELPGRYQSVNASDGCSAVAVEDMDGGWGLLAMDGEELIPVSADIEYLDATADGGVALAYVDGDYSLYVRQ